MLIELERGPAILEALAACRVNAEVVQDLELRCSPASNALLVARLALRASLRRLGCLMLIETPTVLEFRRPHKVVVR